MTTCKWIVTMMAVLFIEGMFFIPVQATDQMPPDLLPAFARAISSDALIEYQITPADNGYQAANPSQGFVSHFTPDSVQIHPRDGGSGWTMTLTGIGYDTIQPVPAATLWAEGIRVEYRRGPALTEWYLNSPLGLEQGLTLQAPPAGRERDVPLRVVFALNGLIHGDEKSITFRTADGQTALRYSGLLAWDADGNALSTQITLEGKTLHWVVEDQDARYPVTIDPWVQQQKLTASDGVAGDVFGYSVAVSGDTAVVGATGADISGQFQQGAAYVFVRSDGIWTQQQKLTASDGTGDDNFGVSVTVSGDTAVVGADKADLGWQGAAYVFVRSGGIWTQQQKLTASDGAGGDHFGISVAISGDTAVFGAYGGGYYAPGAAYVFVRSGGAWIEQQKLMASDGVMGNEFGRSVAVSGDTAVVGAYRTDVSGQSMQGAAYVFVRNGSVWTQQQKLTASDGAMWDQFGISVTVSGDTAVVGAHRAAVSGHIEQGAAYVFICSGGSWTQQAKLTASDGAANDSFGVSVAVSGDTSVVGAWSADVGGPANQGAAYVFVCSGDTWTQQQKLIASDGAANDGFGISVTVSGNTAVIGASLADVSGRYEQGAAYVFTGPVQSGNPYLLWTK